MDKYPGAIWVSTEGKRVANEDGGESLPQTRLAMLKSPDMSLIVILDKKIRDENISILGKPWYAGMKGHSWQWFEEKAQEGVIIKQANTIEELGRLLEMNELALKDTVTRWNECVAVGEDRDFGRQELDYKIETPPFYAIRTVPTVLVSAGGPATNVWQQVLDTSGKVILGLYAAGEVTGYRGFGCGGGTTGCLVFGRQAGLMAAREALQRRI